ncbi:MAG: sporulation protein [Clostridiales bacterium]|nr:sporulation protein [Clostridiales bacterium]MDY3745534.1 spore germination protein GerW family protein [Lachnospiraceae bacterium]
MSENKLGTTVESLFGGMDKFMSSKTVVGEVVHIQDKIIVPFIDVSFGVGAGAWDKSGKNSAAGALGGKMTPSSVLVISENGMKMLPVNPSQDIVSKIIDFVPEVIDKFTKSGDKKKDSDVEEAIKDIKDAEEKSVTE